MMITLTSFARATEIKKKNLTLSAPSAEVADTSPESAERKKIASLLQTAAEYLKNPASGVDVNAYLLFLIVQKEIKNDTPILSSLENIQLPTIFNRIEEDLVYAYLSSLPGVTETSSGLTVKVKDMHTLCRYHEKMFSIVCRQLWCGGRVYNER